VLLVLFAALLYSVRSEETKSEGRPAEENPDSATEHEADREDEGKGKDDDEEDKDDVEEEEEVKVLPSPHVATFWTFADTADKAVFAGEVAEVILGFKNNADYRFNVTRIYASINHPQDLSYYIQNYTRLQYNEIALPGQTTSFYYHFAPDAMLEPRVYFLILSVEYIGLDNVQHRNVFYNSTIQVLERTEGVDTQMIFTCLAILAGVGLVLYFTVGSRVLNSGKYRFLKDRASAVTGSATKVKKGSRNANEWLEGTNAPSKGSRKAGGSKTGGSKTGGSKK